MIGPHKILIPLMIIVLTAVAIKLKKSSQSRIKVNHFLNIASLTLILFQVISIYSNETTVKQQLNSTENESSLRISEQSVSPDIYYIILDAYARSDTLEKIFYFDNNDFIEGLENLGFRVARNAKSNYAHTPFSLSSSLNFVYINEYADVLENDTTDFRFANQLIHQNHAAQFLKSHGYTIINFASGIGPTDNLEIADINYSNGNTFTFFGQHFAINEFYIVFLQTTALSPFIKNALADQARANVQYTFDQLTEIPYQRGNKFTLAHLNIPHPPYLFDENGAIPFQIKCLSLLVIPFQTGSTI